MLSGAIQCEMRWLSLIEMDSLDQANSAIRVSAARAADVPS